ncbi:MAG: response regulator [Pseudobdellovibrionaceae bacterium]|nr:response regulator [Pseudobdellovibrionaceae bacterium]
MTSTPETHRILIVEDEDQLREVIESEIKDAGIEVIGVRNGLEAIEALRHHEVDAVLSDLCMPELSGMQLLQILRANGFYKPFVVLSAFGTRTEAIELLKLGAMDFLEKPIDSVALIKAVSAAVQLGHALPKLRQEFMEQLGLKEGDNNPALEKAITQIAQLRFIRTSKTA